MKLRNVLSTADNFAGFIFELDVFFAIFGDLEQIMAAIYPLCFLSDQAAVNALNKRFGASAFLSLVDGTTRKIR